MLYIDLKYVSYISPYVRNFRQKKSHLYNFSCPICGDSKTNSTKARGYIYEKNQSLFYRCHNCGVGTTFASFLKNNFHNIYKEYIFEKFGANNSIQSTSEPEKTESPSIELSSILIKKIVDLTDNHPARQYLDSRKIINQERIYYTENFAALVEDLFQEEYSLRKEPRIVFPIFSRSGNLIGLQGRALGNSNLRYITVKNKTNEELIFGLETIDFNKKIYVVEGPIDSLFLPNCVAAIGSNLEKVKSIFSEYNVTYIFDNEPRNKQIIALMRKAIDHGFSICIWNEKNQAKDINDMILSGLTENEILAEIENRTYSGLEAKLRLASWAKV
jgi:transcription elongation factor Elf1